MTKDELVEAISKLAQVRPVQEIPDTFVEIVPHSEKSTVHFVRPVADNLVLKASSQNRAGAQATELASRLFEFALANLPAIAGNAVSRIENFDSGEENFDTFLALGPTIVKVVIGKGFFLQTRTTECYAINHIEYSGTETESEAVVRKKHTAFTDVNREIAPVTFGRYDKQTGQKSAPYLGVGKYESMVRFVQELPRDGGICEFENWQRVRVTLTAEQGSPDIDLTFDGQTKTVVVDDALKLLNVLMFKGVDAARGAF